MTRAQNKPDRGNQTVLARLMVWLDSVHELMFSDASRTILKNLAINLSIAGFTIHLVLIFLARSLAHPPLLIAEVGQNYLTAISTPFNFILFYEVLTLISVLPESTTRSIANQFEIVSLIYIRDVFRDIAKAGDLVTGHRLTMETLPMFMDMGAGFLMFFLVAVFQHVSMKRTNASSTEVLSRGKQRFIAQKKGIAAGLTVLLLVMAAYNIVLFAKAVWQTVMTGQGSIESATTFYNDLFTVMIFTDVLILILSLVVSGKYELVFRNAAFIVSIILIRFSLTEGYPFGAPLALVAMVFGTLTLLVYNYHVRIKGPSAW